MHINDDAVTFECSGRSVYANNGIVGIDPWLKIFQGYDGHFDLEYSQPSLSAEERQELSAYMVDLWTRFATETPTSEDDL